ncbi:MAG TPA: hypothetical protein V6C72_07065 [Chroococcales cyanobacterium]
MLDSKFVIIGALFNLFGSLGYAADTIKGKTRPNRVTWLLWALAPLIAVAAEVSEGVGWQSLMTFMVGFGPLLIFLASFVNKQSYWQISRLDIACGVLSVIALILWRMCGSADIAIWFSILADTLAGIPTLIKAYYEPETESVCAYRNGAISAAITLLTVKQWNFATFGFPAYILSTCTIFIFLISIRPKLALKTAPVAIECEVD